jgi:hypothetical protein
MRRRRGSAVVELVVMLPVFLLILVGMMYLGEMSLFRQRTEYGGEYAVDAPGDQSEAAAARGPVSEQFYPSPIGELTVTEQQLADVPEEGEIREAFEDMIEPTTTHSASGRYVIGPDGKLRFVVTTHSHTRRFRHVPPELFDDHVPELVTDVESGWAHRRRADLVYSYDPDYLRMGDWNLDPVEVKTQVQAVTRGEKKREVAVPEPGQNHPIDAITDHRLMRDHGRVPHYPDFHGDQAFWQPN